MDVKERIIKEAGNMFSKYGIRGITMDYIANELGISKRTLYEKFTDKDDLVMQVIERGSKNHKKICFDLIDKSDNLIDAIFKIARINNTTFQKINPLFFEDLKKYHPEIHNKIHKKGDIRDYSISLLLLKRGVNEGIIRNDINIDIANVFIHKIIDVLKTDDFVDIKKEELSNSVFMPYLLGLSTDEGRELIKKHLNNF